MDVSDIFYFFSARGGERGVRGAGAGDLFFIENPRRGGVLQEGRPGELGNLEKGGGDNFLFCGAEMSTKIKLGESSEGLRRKIAHSF